MNGVGNTRMDEIASDPRLKEIAEAWIEEHKDHRDERRAPIGWAYRELNTLCVGDPDAGLAVVWQICRKNSSDPILEVLAAGPLENLLARHGKVVISRIVELARQDAGFRRLLGGVWSGGIDKTVWAQIRAVRSTS
jgi:hypothetical protein